MGFGPQNILICGSRDWTDYGPIQSAITGLDKGSIIIHGGAPGADMIADEIARGMGFHVARVDAIWKFYHKSAGPQRNLAMLRLGIDFGFAYPTDWAKSKGTKDMCDKMAKAKIDHFIYGIADSREMFT